MRKWLGVTLIECLCAMMMSVLLLWVLNTLLLSLDNNREREGDLHAMQENARMSHYFLRQAIEKTGITGCGKLNADVSLINHTDLQWDKEHSINKVSIQDSKPKTDALLLRYVDPHYALLLENMTLKNQFIVSAVPAFLPNDPLLITDCQTAELFRVQAVLTMSDRQLITTSPALTALYANNAWVSRFTNAVFYVDKHNRLMSKENAHPAIALASGIEDLHVLQDKDIQWVLLPDHITQHIKIEHL